MSKDTGLMVDALTSCGPLGLACLVEADADLPAANRIFNLQDIAEQTGLKSQVPISLRTKGEASDGFMGLCILAGPRLQIRNMHRGNLPSLIEPRGYLKAEVRTCLASFTLALTHLSLAPLLRPRQIRHILKDCPEEDLLLMGDFNEWRSASRSIRNLIRKHDFHEVKQPSFPAFYPVFPLDRAFARGRLAIKNQPLPSEMDWKALSDHLPILMDLEVGWEPGFKAEGQARHPDFSQPR